MNITEQTMRAFAELPSVRRGPLNSELNPEYTREHFILSMTHSNLLFALHRAREARELAFSYRGFKVGSSIAALTRKGAQLDFLPGINGKPDEDSELNMHAEQLALRTAEAFRTDMVSIVAVVGETQNDKQSGNEMHTLHPCGLCRDKLANHPMIDKDATLIVSALPDFKKIEVATVSGLMAYHDDENPDKSGVTLFDYSDVDLELFKPYQPPESGVIRIEDDDRANEEEKLWVSTMGAYLFRYRMSLLRPELES